MKSTDFVHAAGFAALAFGSYLGILIQTRTAQSQSDYRLNREPSQNMLLKAGARGILTYVVISIIFALFGLFDFGSGLYTQLFWSQLLPMTLVGLAVFWGCDSLCYSLELHDTVTVKTKFNNNGDKKTD